MVWPIDTKCHSELQGHTWIRSINDVNEMRHSNLNGLGAGSICTSALGELESSSITILPWLETESSGMIVRFGLTVVSSIRRMGIVPSGQLPLLCHSCSKGRAAKPLSPLDRCLIDPAALFLYTCCMHMRQWDNYLHVRSLSYTYR